MPGCDLKAFAVLLLKFLLERAPRFDALANFTSLLFPFLAKIAFVGTFLQRPWFWGRQQQEQDPTNLYIANLPAYMQEADLEAMLSAYGTVISTRILRDGNQQPRGVGFARMDSKDKCDLIIQTFNGKTIVGCKEPLLVKFADGGNKKKTTNRNGPPGGNNGGSNNGWRDSSSGDPTNGGVSTLHYHHHHDQSMSNANGVNQAAAVAAASAAALMANPSMAAAAAAAAQYGQAARASAAAAGYPTGPIQPSPYSHHQQATGFHHQARGGPYNAATAAGQMPSSAFAPPPPSAYHQSARPTFATASAAALQTPQQQAAAAAAAYQGVAAAALQAAGHPAWVHPAAAAAAPQYHLVQSPPGPPQMIAPSHQTMALHLSALMPQLSAQMQQLSLSGASYMTGAPGAYPSPAPGTLYAAQGTPLIQQVALTDASGNGTGDPGQHGGSGTSSVGPPDDPSLVAGTNGKGNSGTPYNVCSQSK